MPVDHFGEAVAARYDEDDMFEPRYVQPAVRFLADLAAGGAALELGIGTGRIALPLSETGVPVHGIDLSEAMVGRLRAKPGAERIQATIGDFAHTRVPGEFALVYLVYNTIGNLTSQDEQVACFQNAADHLESGGHFVIEVGIPDLQRVAPGEKYYPFHISDSHLGFDEYDVVNQGLISHHYNVENGEIQRKSIPFRYVWPAELDLMARLAGMTRRARWADWDCTPFTAESRKHISVWQKL